MTLALSTPIVSGSITSPPRLAQRFDLARQLVVLAVDVMIDRHQPAVGLVEVGAHRVDGRLALRDLVHAVEVAHPAVAASSTCFFCTAR